MEPTTHCGFCRADEWFKQLGKWEECGKKLQAQLKEINNLIAKPRGDSILHHFVVEYSLIPCTFRSTLVKHLITLSEKTSEAVVSRKLLYARNHAHLTPRELAFQKRPTNDAVFRFFEQQEYRVNQSINKKLKEFSSLTDFMGSFETRWEESLKSKNWNMLQTLVASKELSFSELYQLVSLQIKFLSLSFDGSFDNREKETEKVVSCIASLTGHSFERLRDLRGEVHLKELIHVLGKIKEGKVNGQELEGWDIDEYIPMHILFLMRQAVAFKSGWYDPKRLPSILTKGDHYQGRLVDALAKEIAQEILTFHCHRVAAKLNDLLAEFPETPLEELLRLQTYRDFSSLLIYNPAIFEWCIYKGTNGRWMSHEGINSRSILCKHEISYLLELKKVASIFNQKDQKQREAMFNIYALFTNHARMVTSLVEHLDSQNPEFSYATGSSEHSIQVAFTFKPIEMGVTVRVDNRGLWLKKNPQTKNALSPELGHLYVQDLNEPKGLLLLYLIRLARASVQEDNDVAEKMIYNPPEKALRPIAKQTPWLEMMPQDNGNCVHASLVLGALQRFKAFFGDEEQAIAFSNWLANAEAVFSTSKEGALIGRPINDTYYF